MRRAIVGIMLVSSAARPAFGQPPETPPKFAIADVHASAKTVNPFVRISAPRGGRYEIKNATMVDLIRTAYGFDADKVLGGPSWLEMDRYDVRAKVPDDATPDAVKPMLQALLEDRFKLVVHKDTRPLPTYALTLGKKPQLKEADGTGETGCQPQSGSGPRAEGSMRIMMGNPNGGTTTLNLGPDMSIQFVCRNMTMAAFAEGLRGMMGANVGPNPVLDQTGLKGMWNFDVRWSLQVFGPMMASAGERISVFEAVEKQLGLKLEEKQVPTPVIVVDSVNRTPGENPPGLAEALPVTPAPTEFEVASVKPTSAESRGGRFGMQPGGRFNVAGIPLRMLVARAFASNNYDQVAGLPAWADTERFDIVAKVASEGPAAPEMDMESVAPLLRSLLVERFKMTYHTEERPVSAYSLVAMKPKMKKADSASRTSCKNSNAPAGAPPGSRVLTCQNVTMAQFVERLQNMGPGLNWPILDATGIEGGWDFTLTFSQNFTANFGPGRGGGGGDAGQSAGGAPAASDPTGGYTIFEAVEKQLGLKLETQKRPMPVFVIDHIEQRPTEN
jgi:uncharacterized protein (TIGR03435 family)